MKFEFGSLLSSFEAVENSRSCCFNRMSQSMSSSHIKAVERFCEIMLPLNVRDGLLAGI